MAITFSLLGSEGLEFLVRARLEFIRELHPETPPEEFGELEAGAREYLSLHLARGDYLGFAGLLEGEPVCSAGMLCYELPPLSGRSSRKIGHVLNFFTWREYRGRGYGRALMEFIKERAREEGIVKLVLNATALGYPVYAACGFVEPRDRAMILEDLQKPSP